MLLVVALGGNALLRRGEAPDIGVQRENVKVAAEAVAAVAREHRVVLTHGNGPQVGLLALQAEAVRDVAPYPLDVLDAESEGMVGYLLEQELGRHLPPQRLATLLTQIVVDPDDPAFRHPSKPVGPVYGEEVAHRLAIERGWTVAPDGEGWRRVVPSPAPKRILELDTIRILLDHGVTVTCAGGGGIPVAPDGAGGLVGVEAVIDKDRSAALLARQLRADGLLLLTDVDAVYRGFATPEATPLREATVRDLRSMRLPEGSMGPKVDAACRFVEATGGFAAIGSLADAHEIVHGRAGTVIRP